MLLNRSWIIRGNRVWFLRRVNVFIKVNSRQLSTQRTCPHSEPVLGKWQAVFHRTFRRHHYSCHPSIAHRLIITRLPASDALPCRNGRGLLSSSGLSLPVRRCSGAILQRACLSRHTKTLGIPEKTSTQRQWARAFSAGYLTRYCT